MIDFNEVIFAAEEREATRQRQRDNSARLAFSVHRQESRGVGIVEPTRAVRFDVVFLSEPAVFTGMVVTRSTVTGTSVLGSSAVRGWLRNERGHYLGAHMTLEVRLVDPFYQAQVDVVASHHLMFMGVAYKDLGPEIAHEAESLTPKRVGWGGAV